MFALLITLISIALVAALALATLYYGGPIFNLGADRANAAKVAAQGQQIMGAMELYRAEKGVYPNTLADLVSEEYLKSIPVAQAEDARALATALAAPGIWSLSSPGQPVIVLKPVSLATCMAYNKTNLGTSGVLQQARSTHLKQCIGTDVNNLMVVQPKAAADLVFVASNPAAVVQIGPVIATPLPPLSDTTLNGWLPVGSSSSSGNPPPPALTYSAEYETGGSGPLSTVAFPETTVGQSATGVTVIVRNTGTGTLTFSASAVNVGAPFFVSENNCTSASLTPTNYCSFELGFSPTSAQLYAGAGYHVSLNAVNAVLPGIAVTGTGIAVPVVLTAAECLVQEPGHLTATRSSALYNQCTRSLDVRVVDQYTNSNYDAVFPIYGYDHDIWVMEGYPVRETGNTMAYLSDYNGATLGGHLSPRYPALAVGHLRFTTWADSPWDSNPNPVSLRVNDSTSNTGGAWLPFDVQRAAGSSPTRVVDVKFQDQADSAYLPKILRF